MTFVYLEEAIKNHPRALKVIEALKPQKIIAIDHYGEVFNRKSQHFRLQKKQPTFILAKKQGKLVYKAPPTYGIGAKHNYYFSHLLNCPFDCRYCFLQGMYASASFVFFINYEDFQHAIKETICQEKATFFSGYDGDSLAMNPKTKFLETFLPFFRKYPQTEIELRTKSVLIHPLLNVPSFSNCIIAFSLSPQRVVEALEKKTPSLESRLRAIQKLQVARWHIGLRFDPIIDCRDFESIYSNFFKAVFKVVKKDLLHSVTLGSFRLPDPLFKKMKRLKPNDPLLALNREGNQMSQKMAFCEVELLKYIDKGMLFKCGVKS